MKGKGETFVSSTQIAKEINVDPSQVAKDLSFVNISGENKGGGDDICAPLWMCWRIFRFYRAAQGLFIWCW